MFRVSLSRSCSFVSPLRILFLLYVPFWPCVGGNVVWLTCVFVMIDFCNVMCLVTCYVNCFSLPFNKRVNEVTVNDSRQVQHVVQSSRLATSPLVSSRRRSPRHVAGRQVTSPLQVKPGRTVKALVQNKLWVDVFVFSASRQEDIVIAYSFWSCSACGGY